ncbi:hypothetical protein K9M41_02735 [Candidatus Gracilibacteria bacterium]|nr:hypothetical protein [Candidatus Gracilibacteria bacterium]
MNEALASKSLSTNEGKVCELLEIEALTGRMREDVQNRLLELGLNIENIEDTGFIDKVREVLEKN